MTEFFEAVKPALFSFLATVLTVVFSYVGLELKKLYGQYVNTDQKRSVAESTVRYVEQVYADLDGEDKKKKALDRAGKLLTDSGIPVTAEELDTLLEAAVHGLKATKAPDAGA